MCDPGDKLPLHVTLKRSPPCRSELALLLVGHGIGARVRQHGIEGPPFRIHAAASHAAPDRSRPYDRLAGWLGLLAASIGPVPDGPSNRQRQAFAENVRAAREKAELTQEQLAWAAGLHQTEIARIESGRRNPGLETIFKVARGLEIPPGALFKGIK